MTLNLSANNVTSCRALYFLDRVGRLDLRDNMISSLHDELVPMLNTMRMLTSLDLRGNPVQKATKYREQVIMEGRSLQELDGKVVRDNDRRYLYALAN